MKRGKVGWGSGWQTRRAWADAGGAATGTGRGGSGLQRQGDMGGGTREGGGREPAPVMFSPTGSQLTSAMARRWGKQSSVARIRSLSYAASRPASKSLPSPFLSSEHRITLASRMNVRSPPNAQPCPSAAAAARAGHPGGIGGGWAKEDEPRMAVIAQAYMSWASPLKRRRRSGRLFSRSGRRAE